ncbi:MAG: methyltransferase domain-containing protein [Candidatus Thalassarchaeaceae archaeon]|jgi:predicted TPR repeat methyltransferase|nr:methyltransferase domain-containing protein [Candidatus Thalassarchaeaceae archaeon]
MRPAVDVFGEWADVGKDEGMQKGHAPSVDEILTAALEEINEETIQRGFSAVDAGCGNGWVVRLLSEHENCTMAIGVDGAQSMVLRALEKDPEGMYFHQDLSKWSPPEMVDLVHSMEVLYYLDDILGFLNQVRREWLVQGGILAFGVDHYSENKDSLDWPEKVGVRMTTLSEEEWSELVAEAGFEVLRVFRANKTESWPGTLSIIARA